MNITDIWEGSHVKNLKYKVKIAPVTFQIFERLFLSKI